MGSALKAVIISASSECLFPRALHIEEWLAKYAIRKPPSQGSPCECLTLMHIHSCARHHRVGSGSCQLPPALGQPTPAVLPQTMPLDRYPSLGHLDFHDAATATLNTARTMPNISEAGGSEAGPNSHSARQVCVYVCLVACQGTYTH